MIRLRPLPPIALTNNQPAFYDVESVSAIEMISKMYAYLQNMITDYNAFITEVNNELDNFEKSTNKNYKEFTDCIKTLMDNYIQSIDTKIDLQNKKINDAINYMKNNLISTVNKLFSQALNEGEINANLNTEYDPNNELLTFSIQSSEEGE